MKKRLSTILVSTFALALASCGGEDAAVGTNSDDATAVTVTAGEDNQNPSGTVEPTPTPTSTPEPTPTPTPTSTPTAVATKDANGVYQLASIPSNFDPSGMIRTVKQAGTGKPDVVGAFRFTCTPSHNSYDDPIVYPGQPGRAHLHTFFGNTQADAHSTYESLRTTGDSTCRNKLNRSAYWVPAMMNGQGGVIMPDLITVYYKRRPKSDPECQKETQICTDLPRGLRYVFGRYVSNPDKYAITSFVCVGGSTGSAFKTLPEVATVCPVGAQIIARVTSPSCWNGRDLDSPDHRSHMDFKKRDRMTGKVSCPSTHPYLVPTYTMGVMYRVDATLDRSGDLSTSRQTWHFSSDRMAGMTPQISGRTFHADWFGAWDDDILKEWHENCVDKLLTCNDGDLGNTRQLTKGTAAKVKVPHTVAVPPKPTA